MLARTKYMYRSSGAGGEARVKMWVTSMRKAGPTTICTGWLVRYPAQPRRPRIRATLRPANGTQMTIGGGAGGTPPSCRPIVDGIVSLPVRRPAARTVRRVACSVAVTCCLSPLNSDIRRTTIAVAELGTLRRTKEGGWNRKIHRAIEPAKTRRIAGALNAPTAAGRYPEARDRKIGKTRRGAAPTWGCGPSLVFAYH